MKSTITKHEQPGFIEEFNHKGIHVKIEEWRDSGIVYVVHCYDCTYVSPTDSLRATRAHIVKYIDESQNI